MPHTKILSVTGCVLIIAALAANHLITRLTPVRCRVLTVDAFPREIGGWKGGPDHPTSADVQKIIPTAHVVDREYTNRDGSLIDVALVTAAEYNDLHNPMHCMPAAGWAFGALVPVRIGDDVANSTVATNQGERLEVLYWYTASTFRKDSSAQWLRAVRTMSTGTQGNSLLVRLITRRSERSAQMLRDFAALIDPPIQRLKAEALALGAAP